MSLPINPERGWRWDQRLLVRCVKLDRGVVTEGPGAHLRSAYRRTRRDRGRDCPISKPV